MRRPIEMLVHKSKLYKACLLATFVAMLPLSANADLADWYLSGGMNYINSDTDQSSDNFAPYVGVGRMVGDQYSLDLEYRDYSLDLGAAGDLDIEGFNLTGRYYLLGNDNTSPYLGLGLGRLESDGPFGGGSDSHVDVAAGVHWLIGDRWGLRGELRHRFGGGFDALPAAVEFGDLTVSVGLTFALSPRVQSAPLRQKLQDESERTPKTTFILLADEDGSVGRINVSTDGGQQEISQAGYAVDVANSKAAPSRPKQADQAELNKIFGAAQSAFPKKPRHYQLYFEFESAELTADSKRLIPEIMAAIEAHDSVEVGVVGHSDTSGNPVYNLTLSEQRADAIVRMLVVMGVPKDLIQSRSDGENNPAIATPDNVKELKNRRVEITIR